MKNRKLNNNKTKKRHSNGLKYDSHIMQFPIVPLEVKERNYESFSDLWFTTWRGIMF